MSKPKSDFVIMQQMAEESKDIRMSPSLVSVKQTGEKGFITMGVDAKTAQDLALNGNKYLVAIYIVNKEEYLAIRNK